MAVVEQTVQLDAETLAAVQAELAALGFDGWLLYDFHGLNPIAAGFLQLPPLTRRYFVLIPATGSPVALTHRIEQHPWSGWIGEKRVYLSWRELQSELRALLSGHSRIAMEYAADDGVPYVDRVPAGVLELVRGCGVEVVSSVDLVSAFYARWSAEGEASHRRTATVLQETAHAAWGQIARAIGRGEALTEWEVREWIRGEAARRGVGVAIDAIVAVNANAANPHYAPAAGSSAPIQEGDLLLIDLFGKESDEAIFADQTWMAFVGERVPERLASIWSAVRDAREAAVQLARARWGADEPVSGSELDDAARGVIAERGYGEYFIHRTGHSIDRDLHGSGPNIDNLETRDTRTLIAGVGFSVEPGIYIPGDVGFRSEINVFMGPQGPEVTTPNVQHALPAILKNQE
jgi:Xaa-Pro dipeptidase